MSELLEIPLSDEELIELDDFLLSTSSDDEDRLAVDEAHGYVTALAVKNNEAFANDDWMESIWSDPVFADDAQKENMTDLLLRMRNDIVTNLKSGERLEPVVAEAEEEDGSISVSYEGWCFGFMLGVSKEEARWSELPKDKDDLLVPIAKLSMLYVEEEEIELDDEEYETLVDLIPGSVAGLYQYWQSTRN